MAVWKIRDYLSGIPAGFDRSSHREGNKLDMNRLWEFVETATDVAVPFVAMWLMYAVFISHENYDQGLINACSLFLAFKVMYPGHRQRIGDVAPKPESPHIER